MHHPACTNRTVLVAAATLAVMASGAHASQTPSFTNYIFGNSANVNSVHVDGTNIYGATFGGLGTSNNNGTSWTNYDGIQMGGVGNLVWGTYASGSTIYAATNNGISISTNGGTNWTNRSGNGLGSVNVRDVYVSGSFIYAATTSVSSSGGGLSRSTDGSSWTTFTTASGGSGLGSNDVNAVYAVGSTIYAATTGGLSISIDNGQNWVTRLEGQGLGNNITNGVYVDGQNVYVATNFGVSISTDGGATFINYRNPVNTETAPPIGLGGLGSNQIADVWVSGGTIYAATSGGLSTSTDGGVSWTNYTTAQGLGNNGVNSVYVSGGTIYAGTIGGLSIAAVPVPGAGVAGLATIGLVGLRRRRR